jgi:ATP-dependent DNA ligase
MCFTFVTSRKMTCASGPSICCSTTGRTLRSLPLIERKGLLTRFVHRAANNRLRLSEPFDNGAKLLAAAENMGLEHLNAAGSVWRYSCGGNWGG